MNNSIYSKQLTVEKSGPTQADSGADRFIKFKLPGVADTYDDGTLDRIAVFGKSHLAGNSVKFFDLGQRITHTLAVFFDVTGQRAAILDGLLYNPDRIPGQGCHVIGYIAMFFLIAVDEFRSRTFDNVFQGTTIKFATLGADAGYLGVAGFARKES